MKCSKICQKKIKLLNILRKVNEQKVVNVCEMVLTHQILNHSIKLRSQGGGKGNSLQVSYLGNPMDRGAWRVTVHGVTKSQTQLMTKQQYTHIYIGICIKNAVYIELYITLICKD